jgi:deoxyribodipyrimidine photo-lyase
MSIKSNSHIHWFRRDLRLEDQPFTPLLKNVEKHFGVFILDPSELAYTQFGFRKMGLGRIQFLRETLVDLQQKYRERGSDLLIRVGKPELILPELVNTFKATLSFEKGIATEERKQEDSVRAKLPKQTVFCYDDGYLVGVEHLDGLPKFPNSFSKLRSIYEKRLDKETMRVEEIPDELPASPQHFPTLKDRVRYIHPNSAFPFSGGSTTAKQHMEHYLFASRKIDQYKATRNGMVGKDYSSKFSPWLALGAISPRQIVRELQRYEQIHGRNEGTQWLLYELLWRDYFRHGARYFGDRLFFRSGINGELTHQENKQGFQRWMQGNTQNDFIDANMIELSETGFMSNRGRQNAASYLVHQLKGDWRAGAAWFEHHLLDYDPHSNSGNWLYIAGGGFNPKGKSIFDASFQSQHYDGDFKFRQTWLNKEL